MHSVDKTFRTSPKEIIVTILEVVHNLVKQCSWIINRRNYLQNKPDAIAISSVEHVEIALAREMILVADLLDKSKFKKYFGIDLKIRRYHCPDCNNEFSYLDVLPKFAQLEPNFPTSTNLHCHLCGVDRQIIRKKCTNANCTSNVIDVKDNVCLLCVKNQGT